MQVKVIFALEQDEDGYPPLQYESVWAIQETNGHYVIDNIPFFARAATLDDVISVEQRDGELWYVSTIREAKNSLLRVIYYTSTDVDSLRNELHTQGCSTEWDAIHTLVAVNVPPSVDYDQVISLLNQGFKSNKWDYEEAIIRQDDDEDSYNNYSEESQD